MTARALVSAHVCVRPAEMAVTSSSSPETATGVMQALPQARLSPSWPELLSPQHFTEPPVVSAQLCVSPAVTATTSFSSPETSTGLGRSILLPSPSWPYRFQPQHLTPPASVSAQV